MATLLQIPPSKKGTTRKWVVPALVASRLEPHLLAATLGGAVTRLEHLHLQAASFTDIDFVHRWHDPCLLLTAFYSAMVGRNALSRREFETTETEESAMATPAKTGLMSKPNKG